MKSMAPWSAFYLCYVNHTPLTFEKYFLFFQCSVLHNVHLVEILTTSYWQGWKVSQNYFFKEKKIKEKYFKSHSLNSKECMFLFSCYLGMLFLNFVVFLVAWLLSFLQEQTDTSGLVLLPKAFFPAMFYSK